MRAKCSLFDCTEQSQAKGLCWKHYYRLKHHGDPNASVRTTAPAGSGVIVRTVHTAYRRMMVNGRRIFEHRIVMETALGRRLTRDELVHHKNGNGLDNRLENLELMTKRGHGLHHGGPGHQPLNTLSHKFCPSCKTLFKKAAFARNRCRADGLQSICRHCHLVRGRIRRQRLAS